VITLKLASEFLFIYLFPSDKTLLLFPILLYCPHFIQFYLYLLHIIYSFSRMVNIRLNILTAFTFRTFPRSVVIQFKYIASLFYVTTIICNFSPLFQRACWRAVECPGLARMSEPTGSDKRYWSYKIIFCVVILCDV
jgi:hypothetical protein